ncbi:electron transfer flavoprotein beta subunit lysine methyltransferase isoform X1 [Anopheles moucheti]|uniref:electron transfer flavoprotein beta subunit lysine methyltransferase isoform X1 n=1 Tax=Anopheles moucheti TaxID=186751 RepID=UPI0022EFEE2D|nr:electron transfer flavoprotein beta subunit lysine methyltransferase isoform X1 [Anopheles moucheti]XP_052899079.1 electron transfer flavoprotein beta subunit lysine methyltransferase isoform X1 [Anopheles moucheti]
MSQIARHAIRNQMNGAGLVHVCRRLRMERIFHTTTCKTSVKFRTFDTTTTGTTNASEREKLSMDRCRRYSSTTNRTDGLEPLQSTPSPATQAAQITPSSTRQESVRADLDVISVQQKILSNTVLSREHMTPEITLHLITPDCAIYHQPVGADSNGADTGFSADPFWGFFWPGGQALTRFILDTAHVFRGKSVLDVGCGCGASAIAALMVGANRVTANDIDPVALQATLLNAELNGITGNRLVVSCDNFISNGADTQTTNQYEVVLLGDLFYDTEIAADLHPWIQQLARAGTEIFIGDPGRHGITETGVLSDMELLTRYKLPDNICLENSGFSYANVWQFRIPKDGR